MSYLQIARGLVILIVVILLILLFFKKKDLKKSQKLKSSKVRYVPILNIIVLSFLPSIESIPKGKLRNFSKKIFDYQKMKDVLSQNLKL